MEDPAISPDGRRVAVSITDATGKIDIWVKPLDGGPKARLSFDGRSSRGAWRPGTNSLTFASDSALVLGARRLFERDVRGVGSVRGYDLPDSRPIAGVAWSPDGKWLIFRTDDQAPGNADILGIRPGVDSVARPLVATPAEELSPAVSPDGRWLAYSSSESGRREVYVRPFPETDNAKYQVSTAGGTSPVWNPNGRELFFRDDAANLVSVPVIPGATFQPGLPTVLFSAAKYSLSRFTRVYDVSPDGKRFVMIRQEDDAAEHVVVVFNFFEELKRVMKAANR